MCIVMQPLRMTIPAFLERPFFVVKSLIIAALSHFSLSSLPKCSWPRSSPFTRSVAPPQVESTPVCSLICQHKHWSDWFASATHCWLNKPEQQRIVGDSTHPLQASPALFTETMGHESPSAASLVHRCSSAHIGAARSCVFGTASTTSGWSQLMCAHSMGSWSEGAIKWRQLADGSLTGQTGPRRRKFP